MSLAVGDFFELRVYCQHAEQTSINVLKYRVDALSVATVGEQALTTAILPLIDEQYKTCMTNEASFLGVSLRKITPGDVGNEFYSKALGAGLQVSKGMPRQSCGLISWRANGVGPRYRGRTYVPFPSVFHNDDLARPTAAYMTALGELRDILLTGVDVDIGFDETCTYSLYVEGTPPGTFRKIVTSVLPRKWATQRRRGSFGKPNAPPDGVAP